MIRSITTIGPVIVIGLGALAACAGSPEEKAPTPVALTQTAAASLARTGEQITLYGLAEPRSGAEAALATPVEANLDRLVAPNGTRVTAGAVIATLRPSATSRLDLARAQNDATTTAAALARARRLRSDGLASDAEVEAAASAAHTAALTQASLAQRAGQLVLRAPIAGLVQALSTRPGELLPAGTVVARVIADGRLRVRFGIDPALARRARAGMPIAVARANGDGAIATQVASVDLVVDAATRQAALIAQLPDGASASPGEALKATLVIGDGAMVPTIPYAALLDDGGQSYVFVIAKGLAHRRNVTAGPAAGDNVPITAGIAAGERVAITGGTALEDGMKVREGGATK